MCTSQDLYGWIVNRIELPFLLQLGTDFQVLCALKILSFCQKRVNCCISEGQLWVQNICQVHSMAAKWRRLVVAVLGLPNFAKYSHLETKHGGTGSSEEPDFQNTVATKCIPRYSSYLKKIVGLQLTNLNFQFLH